MGGQELGSARVCALLDWFIHELTRMTTNKKITYGGINLSKALVS
jgi:hypothetical protein